MEKQCKIVYHICHSYDNPLYKLLFNQLYIQNYNYNVFFFKEQGKMKIKEKDKRVYVCEPYRSLDRLIFPMKEYKIYKSFEKSCVGREFNFIHAHTLFTAGAVAYKYYKKYKKDYIVSVRGVDVNMFFKYRIFLRKWGLKILLNAKQIVFLSNSLKQEVLTKYVPLSLKGEIDKKSYVIPNGVDQFWLDHRYLEKNYIYRDNLRLIYYGDINKNKNVLKTISVCDKLCQRGVKLSFVIIGKILNDKIRKEIDSRSYIEYHTPKPKEELLSLLRKSDVFIMPSISETFGLSYAEAMSQGVPVIYTENQGFDKIFKKGHVGYAVNCFSSEDIIEKIYLILERYEEISKNCLIESNIFNWERIASLYIQVYEKGCVI